LGRAEDAPSLGINTMNHRYLTPLCIGRLAILIFSVVALLTSSCLGHAQREASAGTDPNLSHPTHVVTIKLNGYTISGLVTLLQDGKTFKYAIALFPGHPGIMRLREENGQPEFELGGNFLVRSRRHWLDEETL
jgi:hypothetical protein